MIASNPNGGADQSAGIGFAIPISTAKAVVEDIMKYGHARRPSLDIVTLPIGPDEAQQIGLPADYGILIMRVLPDGAAAQAGLRGGNQLAYKGNEQVRLGGDLIVGCDGQEITTPQDLSNALNAHHAGDTVVLTIYRGQQRMNVKVTLSDAKAGIQRAGSLTPRARVSAVPRRLVQRLRNHRILQQDLKRNNLQRRFVRGFQHYRARRARSLHLQPPRRAHAPAIPRLQTRKPILRHRRRRDHCPAQRTQPETPP